MPKFTLHQYKLVNCSLAKALGDNSAKTVIDLARGRVCPICHNYKNGGCAASRKLLELRMNKKINDEIPL